METKMSVFWKSAMSDGLYLGAAVVIYSLLLYFLGLDLYNPDSSDKYLAYVNYIIMIGVTAWAQKNYRDKKLNGTITYAHALGYGTSLGIFSALISVLYTFIFMKFIDPSVLDYIFDITEQKYIEMGMSQADIDKAMAMARKIVFPSMLIGGLLGNTFFSFLISLITSIFIKKEQDIFDDETI